MKNDLEQLVRDVCDLVGAEPPGFLAEHSPIVQLSADAPFYLVGLIGGKDVGKTALVNALAGQQLSSPTSFGRGTETAIAYAHESQAAALDDLLRNEIPGRYSIVSHRLPELARQVLLDLPDIDSRYEHHIDLTRRLLGHMLFPVWIQSVEKYADRRPRELLTAVAEGNDPLNFIFCLNKADQLDLAAAEEIRADYARRLAQVLDLPEAPNAFLISAIHPSEFELPRLKEQLLREKLPRELNHAIDLAARRQERSVLRWVDEQNLPERAERLTRLENEAHGLVASRLAEPLVDQIVPAILDDPGHRLALIEQVLSLRMARWPLVNLVHTLVNPLLGAYRVAAAPGAIGPRELVDGHLRQAHPSPSDSIQAAFAILHRSHPMVGELYRNDKLWEQRAADAAAEKLIASLVAAVEHQREGVVEQFRRSRFGGVMAPLRWLLTVGALLWFPFVQPILAIFLERGRAAIARDTALVIVQILSAGYLLRSAGFLIIWFLFLWAYVRWDTAHRVARMLARWRGDRVPDPDWNLAGAAMNWVEGLLDPITNARERIEQLVSRVHSLRQAHPSHALERKENLRSVSVASDSYAS